ncbi:hypothetical protein ACDA63_15285 [Uliginosibacterium sp. sgz301328]|uniref:hypothetical protein n=1 Tax=Uliginosibacterium sp. sgz301328 TaxID=3243764 RepID=UPI00359CFDA1
MADHIVRLAFHFFRKKSAYFRERSVRVGNIPAQVGSRINEDIIGNQSFDLRDRLIIAHCPAPFLNIRATARSCLRPLRPVHRPDRTSRQAGRMGNLSQS